MLHDDRPMIPPLDPFEAEQEEKARAEAARIGGRAGDEGIDPAQRPLVEAGEGVAEGFELAEATLISAAESGEEKQNPLGDPFRHEPEAGPPTGSYGEADHERSSETAEGDW